MNGKEDCQRVLDLTTDYYKKRLDQKASLF